MAKINIQQDCSNSPKQAFLRDFEVAFANNDSKSILDSISEDIHWDMIGEQVVNGRHQVNELLREMLDMTIDELTLANIITHGDTGSVNGIMKFNDGKTYAFCDIFKFDGHSKDAKIKELSSFVIELNKTDTK